MRDFKLGPDNPQPRPSLWILAETEQLRAGTKDTVSVHLVILAQYPVTDILPDRNEIRWQSGFNGDNSNEVGCPASREAQELASA